MQGWRASLKARTWVVVLRNEAAGLGKGLREKARGQEERVGLEAECEAE